MKIMKNIFALIVILAVTTGCQTAGGNRQGGAILGGALGGLLGSQFGGGNGRLAMTAAGAVGGLLIGSNVGSSMDQVERNRIDIRNRNGQRYQNSYRPQNITIRNYYRPRQAYSYPIYGHGYDRHYRYGHYRRYSRYGSYGYYGHRY